MTEILTAAQMRAIEQAAIASGEVTGLELMERAGRGVVEAIFEEWPALRATSHRAVVLCGPGNNGGDGFVVARLLKEWGWEVEVFLYGDSNKLPPDARVNYDRWVGMGEVGRLPFERGALSNTKPAIVIDALFGIGLTRSLDVSLLQGVVMAFDRIGRDDWRRVAVDVPSGLCADSGRILKGMEGRGGAVLKADLTVTFHARKPGHLLADGPWQCGKVVILDIGLVTTPTDHGPPLHQADYVVYDPRKLAKTSGHKFGYGHALILSGPSGQGGAARMSARAALRIGAGLVTLACPPAALPENAARLDAIMLKPVADGARLTEILSDPRIIALCLGPGLGLDARAADLVAVALAHSASPPPPSPPHTGEGRHPDQPPREASDLDALPLPRVGRGEGRGAALKLVLDADALTLLSRDPALFALLHKDCVLTPHGGEFARLFPDIAAKLDAPATQGPASSKVDATREAAARAGCTVLYKGPDTVIASPDGTCAINSAAYDRAAPWLATAGSGDVLAGFITGLLARGFPPQQAAETAAWLHVECARSFGPGLIAEDLPEELPKVFRALGL